MTGKQRATLRAAANGLTPVCYIGKEGVTQAVNTAVEQAIKARELIKAVVQENCPLTAREAAQQLAAQLKAEPVQVIGRRFVLYRRNPEIGAYGI